MNEQPNNVTANAEGRVQLEDKCWRCDYILRTQAIMIDAATGLAVVRCPECGTVQLADSLSTRDYTWHKRLSAGKTMAVIAVVALGALAILPCVGYFELLIQAVTGWGEERSVNWVTFAVVTLLTAGGMLLLMCGLLYRLNRPIRLAILIVVPLLAGLLRYGDLRWPPDVRLVILLPGGIVLATMTAAVGWWCRPLLRGLVRVLCPNASRYIFEDLWQVDGRVVTLGAW